LPECDALDFLHRLNEGFAARLRELEAEGILHVRSDLHPPETPCDMWASLNRIGLKPDLYVYRIMSQEKIDKWWLESTAQYRNAEICRIAVHGIRYWHTIEPHSSADWIKSIWESTITLPQLEESDLPAQNVVTNLLLSMPPFTSVTCLQRFDDPYATFHRSLIRSEPLDLSIASQVEFILDSVDPPNNVVDDRVYAVISENRSVLSAELVNLLDAAIGELKNRLWAVPWLFSQFETVAGDREWLEAAYWNADLSGRFNTVIAIGVLRIERFAPMLNRIMLEGENPYLRGQALFAAGKIQSPENLPTILALMDYSPVELELCVATALKGYGVEAARPFFNSIFHRPDASQDIRTMAAWGLARLGDPQARSYLLSTLLAIDVRDDAMWPVVEAVADLEGWEYKRNRRSVEQVVAKVKGL